MRCLSFRFSPYITLCIFFQRGCEGLLQLGAFTSGLVSGGVDAQRRQPPG